MFADYRLFKEFNMDLYPEYFPSSMKSFSSTSPAIMESIDSPSLIMTVNQQTSSSKYDTDIIDLGPQFECSTLDVSSINQVEKKDNTYPRSFLLINEKEQLKVSSVVCAFSSWISFRSVWHAVCSAGFHTGGILKVAEMRWKRQSEGDLHLWEHRRRKIVHVKRMLLQ